MDCICASQGVIACQLTGPPLDDLTAVDRPGGSPVLLPALLGRNEVFIVTT